MKAWRRWQDYATMLFGVLLFASPFFFAETSHLHAIAVGTVFGVLLIVGGIVSASTRESWRSLVVKASGVLGVIMFIAAVTLGFTGFSLDGFGQFRIEPEESGVALTAAAMAIATVLVGATVRLDSSAPMSQPQGGALAAWTLSKVPGVLVVVGAGAVLGGTLFLPWMVGDATRFLSNAGEGSYYASLAFVGVSIVGGLVGLMMLRHDSSARLALVAVMLALLAGWLILIGYEAFGRRVVRFTLVGSKVAVGPAPFVSGVGAIVWIIGALIGLARGVVALAAPIVSTPVPLIAPPLDPPTRSSP
jgi:hypothetical protein